MLIFLSSLTKVLKDIFEVIKYFKSEKADEAGVIGCMRKWERESDMRHEFNQKKEWYLSYSLGFLFGLIIRLVELILEDTFVIYIRTTKYSKMTKWLQLFASSSIDFDIEMFPDGYNLIHFYPYFSII